jgi:SPX domain protein involved in polyphosphate accumulation
VENSVKFLGKLPFPFFCKGFRTTTTFVHDFILKYLKYFQKIVFLFSIYQLPSEAELPNFLKNIIQEDYVSSVPGFTKMTHALANLFAQKKGLPLPEWLNFF